MAQVTTLSLTVSHSDRSVFTFEKASNELVKSRHNDPQSSSQSKLRFIQPKLKTVFFIFFALNALKKV